MRRRAWTVPALCAIALLCCAAPSVAEEVPPIPSAEPDPSTIPTHDSDVYRYALGGVALLAIGVSLMQLSARRRTPPAARLQKRPRRTRSRSALPKTARPEPPQRVSPVSDTDELRDPTRPLARRQLARFRALSGSFPMKTRKIGGSLSLAKPRRAKLRKERASEAGGPRSPAVERLRHDVRGWTDRG